MRDAIALQRRRRLLLLKNRLTASDENVAAPPHSDSPSQAPQIRNESAVEFQQLLRECGGQTGVQLLVEVGGEDYIRNLSLDRPFVLIGRDSQCDLRIDHPAILPRHAYVQWIEGRLFCCSLNAPSRKWPAVANWISGQQLALGPLSLSVSKRESKREPVSKLRKSIKAYSTDVIGTQADPLSRNPGLSHDVPQVQLKFVEVEQSDNLWPVDRSLTLIGSGAQCKLRLDHPMIPTVLASLIRTPSSLWLVNLTDAEGVQVNDHHATRLHSLDFGDVLQLGPYRAEVTAAPISLKTAGAVCGGGPDGSAIRDLTCQHRRRLGILNQSLDAVQSYLDAEHLNSVPELKSSLQRYILQAQRHHREMQEALERLSDGMTHAADH